jgi:signal transduction histidine kinase
VVLRCDPGLVSLRITDDGAGFHPGAASAGFGLSGMAERAELVGGRLDVRSGPGRGTTIEARIPVTGPYVLDTNALHDLIIPGKNVADWAEIHPAWNITVTSLHP